MKHLVGNPSLIRQLQKVFYRKNTLAYQALKCAQIRDYAIGLNCGIWDYSASIINKFGRRTNFVIPGANISKLFSVIDKEI
jgi:hypothetical protein